MFLLLWRTTRKEENKTTATNLDQATENCAKLLSLSLPCTCHNTLFWFNAVFCGQQRGQQRDNQMFRTETNRELSHNSTLKRKSLDSPVSFIDSIDWDDDELNLRR